MDRDRLDDADLTRRIQNAFRGLAVPAPMPPRARSAMTGRRRWTLRIACVVAGIALAGFLWLRPGSVPQTSAWSAIPEPQDSVLLERAEAACRGTSPNKVLDIQLVDQGLPLSVVDARGNSAAAFFTNGTENATCRFSWDNSGKVVTATTSQGRLFPSDGEGFNLLITAGTGKDLSMVIGHCPLGTASVLVKLSSGIEVTASLGHDFYVAWWLESEPVSTIVARGSDGRHLGEIESPGGS